MVLTDAAGTVRAANPAYCVRHGLAHRLLIGHSIAITYAEADRVSTMTHYRAVFASRANLRAFPAVSQWQDDPEHVTESRITFATQQDGESFMLSSVRLIDAGNPLAPGGRGGAHPAAELIVDAVRDWGIDAVFGLPGSTAPG